MLSKYIREYDWHKKKRNQYPLYIAMTTDKYSLPIAVADSVQELAKMVGVSAEYIYSELKKKGKRKMLRYEIVWVEREELENEIE